MKRQRRRSVLLITLLIMMLSVTGCGSSAAKNGTLKIGVRQDIMNFGYYNEDTGKYYGLEIDIANEMAKRMGYDVEFVHVEPETRKEMLLNGDVDCLVATYSIADTRKENFDFSPPYYTDHIVLMVEKSTMFNKIEELQNKKFGVLDGANAGPLLAIKLNELGLISDKIVSNTDTETQYEGAHVTKAAHYADLDVMLEEGVIDAACMDACIANTYMDDYRKILDTSIEAQDFGVATVKGSELSEPVSKTIQEMLDDGTIKQLTDKWN